MRKLYDLLSADGIDVKKEHPLAPHSSFRVGGNARLAAFPKSLSELICVLRHARATAVRFSVFGNASNVVFPDGGFDGLVVFTGACRNVEIQDKTIISSCGASMTRVASLACENGLGGAEFMHGIPGTVGGGVYMNAGALRRSVPKRPIGIRRPVRFQPSRAMRIILAHVQVFTRKTMITFCWRHGLF